MSYAVVGHCPKCGAPIYAPLVWHGIIPPLSTPSCMCAPRPVITTITKTSGLDEVAELAERVANLELHSMVLGPRRIPEDEYLANIQEVSDHITSTISRKETQK